MSLKNKSEIDMIQGPEFINLQPLDINPLMEKCDIKVFYLGHNRNHSYINRETALEMAKTLRGTPIVAAYNKDKEDFGGHGHIMHIEDGEVTFSVKTIPYGFVAPDAEVWFQKFTDTDEFDNKVERTYLMTTGYLWTGQFEELSKVISEGQPQSMELDPETLQGHWAKDNNLNIEFFIITDATFSKLCILGDDVEPCYEGSSVTASFSFQQTLFSMMDDLKHVLGNEGEVKKLSKTTEDVKTVFQEDEVTEDFVKTSKKEDETKAKGDDKSKEDPKNNDGDDDETKEKEEPEEDDPKKKKEQKPSTKNTLEEQEKPIEEQFTRTEEEFTALTKELESLRAQVQELSDFKVQTENKEKDALINSYYMLSDEDKADVIARKAEYTLDEIKAKLALIYVEKNVDFNLENKQDKVDDEDNDASHVMFSLDNDLDENVPAFIEALRHVK